MLQETGSLLFYQLSYHVTQNGSNGIEPLIRSTNIIQPVVIEKYLLYDKYRNGLAEFRSSFHYTEAERNDFSREQEVYNIRRIILHKSPNDTERCESQILEWARFRGGI